MSANEDQENYSLAGYFNSFLNINSSKIIKSYQRKSDKKDEILIQEMVSDVKFSRVITTNDKVTGAPYIQINFSTGNKTNTVTSGVIIRSALILIESLINFIRLRQL